MTHSGLPVLATFYAAGWMPLLLLLATPLVAFPDVSPIAVVGVLTLVLLGYLTLRTAGRGYRPAAPAGTLAARHGRATIVFSVLSIVGCQFVATQQSVYLGTDVVFDNLQERYIALVESSLQGDATASLWSTLGNLLRAFLFVAMSSFVAYSTQPRRRAKTVMLGMLLAVALAENFLLSVSRLQLVFFLICAVIASIFVAHPLWRRKTVIVAALLSVVLFLVITTSQRLNAKFGDAEEAVGYVTTFFGVELLPFGALIVEQFGVAVLTLCIYIIQGVPELVRLISNNTSPYALGTHSLYLVLSPLFRAFGVQLGADSPPISNQGVWWGFMGDLYLDFGIFFPVVFLLTLCLMVRLARHIGDGPVYGLAFRVLTAGLLLIVPYTGILNTYSVSYFGLAVLAAHESARLRRRRRRIASAAVVNLAGPNPPAPVPRTTSTPTT